MKDWACRGFTEVSTAVSAMRQDHLNPGLEVQARRGETIA